MGRKVGNGVGRTIHKLSATQVAKRAKPGYVGDGGGLWLQVSPALTKSWIFRFTLNGKSREMGLGAVHTLSLAEARDKAREQRQILLEGIDPIEARGASRRTVIAAAAHAVTFKAEAEAYIEAHRAGWKNVKHGDQWANTLETYAYPHIGDMLVADIETAHVLQCLQPIWTTKTVTAVRLRGRIESVLDRAAALKHRKGDNPARWKGNLDTMLANPKRVAKTEHHAALPYTEMGAFMQALRADEAQSARALELTILTACRTSEIADARWDEVDLDAALLKVPAKRMKAKIEHRVPLSKAALRLLKALPKLDSPFLFPGRDPKRPISNMTMLVQLQRRMQRPDLTVHGFRSTFRDWAAEQTNTPAEVVEMALAHKIEDPTEAAYRRGNLIEKRAKLMQAWADYCGRVQTDATVTPIRARKA